MDRTKSCGAAEPRSIGQENVRVARKILTREKIPITSKFLLEHYANPD